MTLARLSPSGPAIDVETTTDGIENLSNVPGATVTEALNTILATEDFPLFDDFIGGQNATASASVEGPFGALGWSMATTGGSISRPAASDAYVGAYTLQGNAGATTTLYLGQPSATLYGMLLSQAQRVEWRVLPCTQQLIDGVCRFGLGVATAANFGTDGLYFEAGPALSGGVWRAIARRGSANTSVVSTIPWSSSIAQSLVMSRDPSTGLWSFFVDGVLAGAPSPFSVLPTTRLNPAAQVTGGAAAQSTIIDLCSVNYTPA